MDLFSIPLAHPSIPHRFKGTIQRHFLTPDTLLQNLFQ